MAKKEMEEEMEREMKLAMASTDKMEMRPSIYPI